MRKKLESKKAVKDNDKLAIEPKSLADFKVPEIPLKRIQDLYKSSDLLRSRSESDLLSTKNQQRDLLKIVTAAIYDDRREKDAKSTDIRSTNASEIKSTTDTNRSAQSIFEEYTSTEASSKPQIATSASSNDARSEKYTILSLDADEKQLEESVTIETRQNSVSHDAEDIRTIISTMQSEMGIQTISDARSSKDHSTINTESSNRPVSHTDVDHSQSKTLATQSEILEKMSNIDYSRSIQSKSDYSMKSAGSNHDILTFSKKLDSLQLNNKNLNENISCLENGLKVLSEMMSRFSNKTGEELKIDNDEKSTSQDISELLSKSVFSDRAIHIENKEKNAMSPEEEVNTEPSILSSDRRSKSSNDLNHDKRITERADNDISTIISTVTPTLSNLVHEIDYEAKSKEIMNEIEKSILSEHNKMVRGDYNISSVLENDMQNLRKDNEELLNDLISLELDVKSISEILSKVSESRRSLNLATDTATQIIDVSKGDASSRSDLNEANEEEESVTNQANATHSAKLSEQSSLTSMHSPIVAGHRSKESYETNSQRTRSALTNQISHVVASGDLKSSEKILELSGTKTDIINDVGISSNSQHVKDIQTSMPDNTVNSTMTVSNIEKDRSCIISAGNISRDKDDWTTSDSFEVPQNEISTEVVEREKEDSESEDSRSHSDRTGDTSNNYTKEKNVSHVESAINKNIEVSSISYVDISTFIPKGESTNIEIRDMFANIISTPHVMKSNDELDDILDIIARENNQKESIPDNESEKFNNTISDSVTDLLEKVENVVDKNEESLSNVKGISYDNEIDILPNKLSEAVSIFNDEIQDKESKENLRGSNIISMSKSKDDKTINLETAIDTLSVDETGDKSAINIKLHVEINDEESLRAAISEGQKIIITELDSDSIEDRVLPELKIDAKVELAEDDEIVGTNDINEKQGRSIIPVEIQECLESISEQDSSDGEQLDNLVEVAESGLDIVEKLIAPLRASTESAVDDEEDFIQAQEGATNNTINVNISLKKTSGEALNESIAGNINKTFDILKGPDYEDISEESLEVSEILDKNELFEASTMKKPTSLPEKYQAMQKSDEVLRILDEISQKSSPVNSSPKDEKDLQSVTEEISELLGADVSAEDNVSSLELTKAKDKIGEGFYTGESRSRLAEEMVSRKKQTVQTSNETGLVEEKSSGVSSRLQDEGLQDDKSSQIIYELRERVSRLQEQDGSSESSEAGDTPRGVSEIEMDSPRDFNDSRLDIDILDDDLLSGKAANENVDMKTNFHSASIVATSEKDIEAMIYKLKGILVTPLLIRESSTRVRKLETR